MDSSMVPLPTYAVGQTFIYSDGGWERVTAMDSDDVSWIDHTGQTSSGSPDFTYRRTLWQSKTRRGERWFSQREDIAISNPASLWPLAPGNRASFLETGTWLNKKSSDRHTYRTNWKCRVEGAETVEVMAGRFETWRIRCERFSAPRSSGRLRLREIYTWNYSPVVGHYVLHTRRTAGDRNIRRKELLAVLPPVQRLDPIQTAQMNRSFQNALEFKRSSQAVPWRLIGSEISGATTAGEIYKIPDGTYCRRYIQLLEYPEQRHAYYGMACRDSDGIWVIPRR